MGIKQQAVVATAHVVTFSFTSRQRGMAVTALVSDGRHAAVAGAVHKNGFAEYFACEQPIIAQRGYFMIPSNHIPTIAQPHAKGSLSCLTPSVEVKNV
jgi:hypothetical protein